MREAIAVTASSDNRLEARMNPSTRPMSRSTLARSCSAFSSEFTSTRVRPAAWARRSAPVIAAK